MLRENLFEGRAGGYRCIICEFCFSAEDAKIHSTVTAALYELFEANSQCVKNGERKCPLLVVSVQFAEAINHFFSEKD
jgi:hypothetical protein